MTYDEAMSALCRQCVRDGVDVTFCALLRDRDLYVPVTTVGAPPGQWLAMDDCEFYEEDPDDE